MLSLKDVATRSPPDEAVLRLFTRHKKGVSGLVSLPVHGQIFLQALHLDTLLFHQFHEFPCRNIPIGEYVSLYIRLLRFFHGCFVKISKVFVQFNAHIAHRLQGRQRCQNLIPNRIREGKHAVFRFLRRAPAAALFEQYADGALRVGIGGTFSVIEIVVVLSCVEQDVFSQSSLAWYPAILAVNS